MNEFFLAKIENSTTEIFFSWLIWRCVTKYKLTSFPADPKHDLNKRPPSPCGSNVKVNCNGQLYLISKHSLRITVFYWFVKIKAISRLNSVENTNANCKYASHNNSKVVSCKSFLLPKSKAPPLPATGDWDILKQHLQEAWKLERVPLMISVLGDGYLARGVTPLYGLYRYVRPQRVWFSAVLPPFWS